MRCLHIFHTQHIEENTLYVFVYLIKFNFKIDFIFF